MKPRQTNIVPAFERKEVSIVSPLRYPGAKRRHAGYIKEALRLNDLQPGLFVEPFAGGASVALQLVNDEAVERIGLIERDPLVAAFWKTVFFDADWLVRQVEGTPVTVAQWCALKSGKPKTVRERAFACLYLNRTSFSGIMAPGAGPLGGYAQASAHKIDCRFTRQTLVRRIRQAEALREKVAFVWNLSWADGLARIRKMQARGSLPGDIFYYVDPPFFDADEGGVSIGQIIYDINGEYANANRQDIGAIADIYPQETVRYRMLDTPGFQELRTNFYEQIDEGFRGVCCTL